MPRHQVHVARNAHAAKARLCNDTHPTRLAQGSSASACQPSPALPAAQLTGTPSAPATVLGPSSMASMSPGLVVEAIMILLQRGSTQVRQLPQCQCMGMGNGARAAHALCALAAAGSRFSPWPGLLGCRSWRAQCQRSIR